MSPCFFGPKATPDSGKLHVVASFYPLYEFSSEVAGLYADVTNIMGNGVEPHDFEPSPKDIVEIYSADVFIYNGASIDSWASDLTSELQKKGVTVVDMSKHMQLLPASESRDTDNSTTIFEPHFWTDPVNVKQEVEVIRDTLVAKDPSHANEYKSQSARYEQQLSDLNNEYVSGLSHCALRTIIVSHDAFAYPAKRYNLNALAIAGLTPD